MDDFNALPFLDDEVALAAPGVGEYEELRRRYGVAVPGVLRELLAVRNGGRVRRLWVTSRNAALRRGLHVSQFLFLKLDDFSPEGVVGCFRGWREAMGPQGLPFALDEAGNVFFVDLSVEPAPVMFARQEGEIEVFAVSPDLATFFAELREGDELAEEAGLLLYDGTVKREVPLPVATGKKWGCCSVRVLGLGVLFFRLFNWWASKPIWEDGNLRVYNMDGRYRLGVYHDPGYLNLLEEDIVEIGRDDRWLVVRQWRDNANCYYIIKKPLSSLAPWDFDGSYSREEFDKKKVELGLPPFTWKDNRIFHQRDE